RQPLVESDNKGLFLCLAGSVEQSRHKVWITPGSRLGAACGFPLARPLASQAFDAWACVPDQPPVCFPVQSVAPAMCRRWRGLIEPLLCSLGPDCGRSEERR